MFYTLLDPWTPSVTTVYTYSRLYLHHRCSSHIVVVLWHTSYCDQIWLWAVNDSEIGCNTCNMFLSCNRLCGVFRICWSWCWVWRNFSTLLYTLYWGWKHLCLLRLWYSLIAPPPCLPAGSVVMWYYILPTQAVTNGNTELYFQRWCLNYIQM